VTSTDLERLARTAYDAYRDARRGSAPPWEDLSEQERQAWMAAAAAAASPGDVTLTDRVPAQSLIVQAGDNTHVFHADFTAGRHGMLPVSDEHASSHHARFQYAHGFWYVEDLGSTNGTYLNGRRVLAAQRLRKGDKIRIGRTTLAVIST
jgi:pSer/pThr/pTyr-binding forkhead associated (FHA) protein